MVVHTEYFSQLTTIEVFALMITIGNMHNLIPIVLVLGLDASNRDVSPTNYNSVFLILRADK